MKQPPKRVPERSVQQKDGPAPRDLSSLCLDPGKPPEVRAKILLDLLNNAYEQPALQQAVLTDLLRQSGARTAENELAHLKEAYELALAELAHGAVRPATFLAVADGDLPGPGPR